MVGDNSSSNAASPVSFYYQGKFEEAIVQSALMPPSIRTARINSHWGKKNNSNLKSDDIKLLD